MTDDFSEGLHGHNYYVEIEIFGEVTNDGMIFNFLSLDKFLKDILSQWDHYTLIPSKNKDIIITEVENNFELQFESRFYSIPQNEVKLLECQNVTAEYLAKSVAIHVKEYLQPLNKKCNIKKLKVVLWETPTYYASYSIQLSCF
jgi:6-pyruvoyltetrahydropterin/6-carboxytetrahydropterin synthase